MSKRTVLSVSEKHQVCQYKEEHPAATHLSVAKEFTDRWRRPVSRRAVREILHFKERWARDVFNADAVNVKRFKGPKYKELEDALEEWILEDGGEVHTDEALKKKARELGRQMGIEKFAYSSGWLQRFKGRRRLSKRYSGDADSEVVDGLLEVQIEEPPPLVLIVDEAPSQVAEEAPVTAAEARQCLDLLKRYFASNSNSDIEQEIVDVLRSCVKDHDC